MCWVFRLVLWALFLQIYTFLTTACYVRPLPPPTPAGFLAGLHEGDPIEVYQDGGYRVGEVLREPNGTVRVKRSSN